MLGINGSSNIALILIHSSKLYKTVFNLPFLASSLARIHGVVSSIYLLHFLSNSNIASIASLIRNSFIFSSTILYRFFAVLIKSASTCSYKLLSPTTPSKYFLDILIVLLTKLPSIFAKSAFVLETKASSEKLPSLPKGTSLNAKYLTASTP